MSYPQPEMRLTAVVLKTLAVTGNLGDSLRGNHATSVTLTTWANGRRDESAA
jgi:hypothetical protein